MLTRTQRYAAQIIGQVTGVPEEQRKKYGTMAHKLPVLVRTAGLAQALAFVECRGSEGEGQKLLLDHLAAAVGQAPRNTLLNASRTAGLREYRRLTHEVLAALEWYKRFAESVLDVLPGDEPGGDDDEHQEANAHADEAEAQAATTGR